MRCLTLLEALNAEALFVCSDIEGHLGDLVVTRGHRVHLIESDLTQDDDAVQTAALAVGADWVIVDHYGLDAEWERMMPAPVMVIDDLADRAHDCALLLDQNLGRNDTDYNGLVPDACVRLTGPHYALLRPEFAAARPATLAARALRTGTAQHVMIVMGGTDAPDATGWVIAQIAQMELPEQMIVTAVLGATAPNLEAVRDSLRALPCKSELLVGTNRMAELMAQSDLAIGAAGSTSLERCALGLPTVIVVIADNQIDGARALAASGAARQVALHANAALRTTIAPLLVQGMERAQMAQAAATLCDGGGALRVADALVRVRS
jgi:UDP-2,4-diacetamido-2,4,6-trideoxy-beta-L-altropyranose hydrolase